jgi:hypothetical protein
VASHCREPQRPGTPFDNSACVLNTPPESRVDGGRTIAKTRLMRIARLELPLLVIALLTPVAEAGERAAPVACAWTRHELVYEQPGFTSIYSCAGLATKVRALLRASGARQDLAVTPKDCGVEPTPFARVQLVFWSLAPAGRPRAGADAPGRQLGSWQKVWLAPWSPHELTDGDCELVERFRDQVLPLMTTRNVADRVRCVPHQLAGSVVDLRFEVFAAAGDGREPGDPVH